MQNTIEHKSLWNREESWYISKIRRRATLQEEALSILALRDGEAVPTLFPELIECLREGAFGDISRDIDDVIFINKQFVDLFCGKRVNFWRELLDSLLGLA